MARSDLTEAVIETDSSLFVGVARFDVTLQWMVLNLHVMEVVGVVVLLCVVASWGLGRQTRLMNTMSVKCSLCAVHDKVV